MALVLLIGAPARAQHTVQPTTSWGGQVVPEQVPYQPSSLYQLPGAYTAPSHLQPCITPQGPCVESVPAEGMVFLEQGEFLQPQSQLPPGARDGVFQKIYLTGTWLPQLEGDSLGWGDLETGVVLGFPFLRRDTPLVVTPLFGIHFLERPAGLDLPDRVYDAEVEFRHLRKFGDGPWAMDASVKLGSYSDFEVDHSDAFRVTGRGFGVYEGVPGTKWVLGVLYVNRAGISVLPAGGVIFESNPDVKYEILFPRPRVAWRLEGGIPGSGDERWFYLAGEFGGGVWSVQRPTSLQQVQIDYSDVRIMAGCERIIAGGLSRRFEFGYVFGRTLRSGGVVPDQRFDDTLMARVGIAY